MLGEIPAESLFKAVIDPSRLSRGWQIALRAKAHLQQGDYSFVRVKNYRLIGTPLVHCRDKVFVNFQVTISSKGCATEKPAPTRVEPSYRATRGNPLVHSPNVLYNYLLQPSSPPRAGLLLYLIRH